MMNDVTPNLALPLPHAANDLVDDVARLRAAITAIDAALHAKADSAAVSASLAALIGAAPGALDTLKELADAIANDPAFAADVAAHIAALTAALNNLNLVENKSSATIRGELTAANVAAALGAGHTISIERAIRRARQNTFL